MLTDHDAEFGPYDDSGPPRDWFPWLVLGLVATCALLRCFRVI